MEQLLPLLEESWTTPSSGGQGIKHHWGWGTEWMWDVKKSLRLFFFPQISTSALSDGNRMQLINGNTAQSCLQRSNDSTPTNTPPNIKAFFKTWGFLNVWHLFTELFTRVNKTFGTKYKYRNAKKQTKKLFKSCFSFNTFCTVGFSLAWQYLSSKVQIHTHAVLRRHSISTVLRIQENSNYPSFQCSLRQQETQERRGNKS